MFWPRVFLVWGGAVTLLLMSANYFGWGLPWDDDDRYPVTSDIRSNPRGYAMHSYAHAK